MDRAMARGDNAACPLVTRISPPSTVLRDSTEYFVLGTQLSPVLVLVLPISISPVTDSGTRFVHFYLTVAGPGTRFVHLYLTVAGPGTRFVHLYLTCRRF